MAATTVRSDARGWVLRFDGVERLVHWANAALFGICIATAGCLYIDPLSAAIGRRELLKTIHVYAGLCLPVPLVLALAGRWGRVLRADLGRLNRWHPEDFLWFRSLGRDPFLRSGKFNAGQKLNTAFTGGAILLFLGTGSIMRWFDPFPLAWRTGATFVHDWLALAMFVAITGHILYALRTPHALEGMVSGWAPKSEGDGEP